MTKHSKNNTASSVFSYAEYKMAGEHYGTKRQRLGNESMRKFNACSLCLNTAREPVSCADGHIYCKECALTDILTQKKDIKKQKDRLEKLKQEAQDEKLRAQQAARERVLEDFEKGQLGLGNSKSSAISASENSGPRGTKRKFEFDATKVETLAREAEEAALRQIEREQADALKAKLPDFWLPSLTPTYTSSGPPQSLKDIKVQTMCSVGSPAHAISLKTLYPVKWTPLKKAEPSSATTNEVEPICPACKKALSNNIKLYLARPCGHVVCKTCHDTLVKPAKRCIECDTALPDKDVIELNREGTGFASGGQAEAVKSGTAFQG
ncbi:hypothetical protein DL96DRAFT_1596826 [Flagelloscypha sp. PMI_526]|nr:hypothetical protein DL96DRAFT_1596826 [Flagelloscypha sp. PMI_526]